MVYQSKESSIILHLTKPIKIIHNHKPCVVEKIIFGNPYQVTIYEQDGVCYVVVDGFGSFPIKETMEEVCKMLDIFKEDFDKEFDEWYNKLPADPEKRKLITGI